MRKLTICILCLLMSLCLAGLTPISSAAQLPVTGFPAVDITVAGTGLINAYFPVFPIGVGDEAAPQLLPVISNYALDGSHVDVTHAIIVIPDYTRDAKANAAMIVSLAGDGNAASFILAPQFLLDSDMARLSAMQPEQSKALARWPLDGWINGGDSLAVSPQKPISSFTVMDLLLLYLSETKIFPNLQTVTIAGHGEGADFVQRYAAAGQAPDILDRQHLTVRFLAANASSYLYFTAPRFLTTKPGGKPSLSTPDVAHCPAYNAYPYGLDNPNDYVKRVGAGAIKLRYLSRSVTYLAGEKAAEGDALVDNSCAAILQGPNRVARLTGYNMYMNVTFGDASQKRQRFSKVPKAGYEPAALFGSVCGMSVLFGDGECAGN